MKLARTVTWLIFDLMILTMSQRSMLGAFPNGIAGTWKGTFNGQPIELKADGSYPETVTSFELMLAVGAGNLTGILVTMDHAARKIPIKNSQCDQDGCSFEVVDNDDGEVMTWRVESHGTGLGVTGTSDT